MLKPVQCSTTQQTMAGRTQVADVSRMRLDLQRTKARPLATTASMTSKPQKDDRSRAGRFQAKATLTADFDATGEGTLSGSITEFDTEPTWSVTLKSRMTISTGAVAAADDSVSWSIRGLPRDGGQWEAKFYSNFEDPADTAQPTGVAGAFTAQYGVDEDHRKMIGAFGAEREN